MNKSLADYYKELRACKILDKEELNRLILEAQKGNSKARDKVVMSTLRYVVTLAKSFEIKGMPIEDLIASGNEGLLIAITKFDPSKEVPFISYATFWIKQAMYTLIYYNRDTIRLPLTQRVIANKIAKVTNDCIKSEGYIPSSTEIAKQLNISVSVVDLLSKFNIKPTSLDEHLGGEDAYSQVQDIIPSDYDLEYETNYKFIYKEVLKAIDKLATRDKDMIYLLMGTYGITLNLQEVANLYGITKERVRQLRDKALNKIKEKFKYVKAYDLFGK